MKTYSGAVVGCGSGGKLSLVAYGASDRYELKAACDLDPEVLETIEELYPGVRTFNSHESMFFECPTDVVSVSTFPPSHRDIAFDALKLPLSGILVEKPLADSATAGGEILSAVKEQDLPLVVPHSWLARDIAQEIKARVLGGEIGSLYLMEVQNAKWDIMNAGIHWVHFFLSCIPVQAVDLVMASCDTSTKTYRDGLQVETMGVTYVQMESGTRMVMQTGDDTKVARGDLGIFRFYGETGTLEWCLTEGSYAIRNQAHPGGTTVEVSVRDPRRPHHRYLDSLAEQMDCGVFDYAIPDLSLTALEICEAAYLSANARCRVVFPLASFDAPAGTDWTAGKPYAGSGGRDGRKL